MRVLISAYACEPDKGSEPGVGWHWSLAAAAVAREVTVLTRGNNRPAIEARAEEVPANLRFVYLELPDRWVRWKGGPRRARLYYLLWQRLARAEARRQHAAEPFDLVHHLTWASISLPIGVLGATDAPTVVGPVGGGVSASWASWRDWGLRGGIYEVSRAALQRVNQVNPAGRARWGRASRVLVQNVETAARLPARVRDRSTVAPNAGVEPSELRPPAACDRRADPRGTVRAVFAGRVIPLKGLRTGIRALAAPSGRSIHLVVLGDGPDLGPCRRLAAALGVSDRVEFRGAVSRGDVLAALDEADVLLLPTQHDEGPLVVIEALARGVRPVVLDRGGPAVSIGEAGVAVAVRPVASLPERLAAATREAVAIPATRALDRAAEYTWENKRSVLSDAYGAALAGADR